MTDSKLADALAAAVKLMNTEKIRVKYMVTLGNVISGKLAAGDNFAIHCEIVTDDDDCVEPYLGA